ncbi:helix-turn-helix domain-containing protein [Specibacter cremeus]|uniref:helix-turn-helix domain-containing protein n=1 Tax=Specibacter cremeus TaxID=1629051 RepID=UPI000F78838D|nr:helix-turn-helix domain-containing protein [Specibacter cremeus]
MPESRGHLNPGTAGVSLDRFELGPGTSELVRHIWIVRWNLPIGVVRPQRVLTYPACNAILSPGATYLFGPDPRVSVAELAGESWTVGVLFRPVAAPFLTGTNPRALVGATEDLTHAPGRDVTRIMTAGTFERSALVGVLRAWLAPIAEGMDDDGRLVNTACRLAEQDGSITRAADLAARLDLAPRTLERLVQRYVGVTPKWLIECRRLQHAASTVFTQPDTDLSGLAVELGYTDYAHFSRQYKQVLGESPADTRRSALTTPLDRGRRTR